jgi:hypothetical protein
VAGALPAINLTKTHEWLIDPDPKFPLEKGTYASD